MNVYKARTGTKLVLIDYRWQPQNKVSGQTEDKSSKMSERHQDIQKFGSSQTLRIKELLVKVLRFTQLK